MGMQPWKRRIFNNSPMWLRKFLANMEAMKRVKTRRGGDYQTHYEQINIKQILFENHPEKKLNQLNQLLATCRSNIPYYREVLPEESLLNMQEIDQLPLLRKEDLRTNLRKYVNENPRVGFWHGTTGGTAGQLAFVRDQRSLHYEYAVYDKLYAFAADKEKVKKARFSNVPILKSTSHQPPFCMEVSMMKQLQCSIYHLDERTYGDYLQSISEYGADIGTGYAFLWQRLAEEALAHDDQRLKLKAVVSDSEGMTGEQKKMVEKAFDCRVYQTYGTSEVGIAAVQCEQGYYHILDRVHVEVVGEDGKSVPDGSDGEIVVTDLWSMDAPFIRYCPGDRGSFQHGGCSCGWESPYLETLTGRVRDYIVTAQGVKVNHIARVMGGIPGVRAFQYIQDEPGQLHIRVEARADFDPTKMEKAKANAKNMIGEMRITWEVVEEIEKAPSGKIKTTIRNF